MNGNYKNHLNWLKDEQKLLLQAGFLPETEAISALKKWEQFVDIEEVDQESYILLPLVYRNLLYHGFNGAIMARLKGVYLRRWYENKILLYHVDLALQKLKEANIEILVIREVALMRHYYKYDNVRDINIFMFLSKTDNLDKSTIILEKLDWELQISIPSSLIPGYQNLKFKHKKSGLSLIINYFLDVEIPYELNLWKGNKIANTRVGLNNYYYLIPEYEFLLLCFHLKNIKGNNSLRRLSDACMLIQHSGNLINWHSLTAIIKEFDLVDSFKEIILGVYQVLNWDEGLKILEMI